MLSWDQGLGGAFVPLFGDTTNSLLTEYIVLGVSSGTYYRFVYKARNTHGDGPDSDPITILAATIPTQMAEPTVAFDQVALSYVISIQSPNSGGAGVPISSFEIQVKNKAGAYLTPSACTSSPDILADLYCEVSLDDLV